METYVVNSTTVTLGYGSGENLISKVLTKFAVDDIIEVSFPNEATSRTNGRRSVTIAKREDGDVADVVFRVQKYSTDDKFLETLKDNLEVINGSLKSTVVKDGTPVTVGYTFQGGSFTAQPTDTTNNNEPQAMMEYTIQFRSASRDFK